MTTPRSNPPADTQPEDPFLTVAELATQCRVSPMTIYREIHDGNIRTHMVGRSFRIRSSDARAYLDSSVIGS